MIFSSISTKALLLSLFICLLYPADCLASKSRSKFRPFAGQWQMLSQAGQGPTQEAGLLTIGHEQNSASIEFLGDLAAIFGEKSIRAKVFVANKAGTVINIYTEPSSRYRLSGKFKIDTETYLVIYGTLKFYDLEKQRNVILTANVAAHAVRKDRQKARESRLFLDVERVGARGAKAGKTFFLRGIIEAKGPTPIPNQRVFVFMQALDNLSVMEVSSNNRMVRCGELHNKVQKIRTAWCLLRSLGPGTTDRASFTVRMVPSEEHFARGGKFKVSMAIGAEPDQLIKFVPRPRKARATINVKGLKNGGQDSKVNFAGTYKLTNSNWVVRFAGSSGAFAGYVVSGISEPKCGIGVGSQIYRNIRLVEKIGVLHRYEGEWARCSTSSGNSYWITTRLEKNTYSGDIRQSNLGSWWPVN